MAAIELFKGDGTAAGIFYCSQCRIVYDSKEKAEFCHEERLCACGNKIESIHSRQSKCSHCEDIEWKEKERKRESERFEAAKKINATEYKGEHVFLGDQYYDSVEEVIDQFLEGQEPEYVWACADKKLPTIDLNDVTCNLVESMWQDAEVSDLNGVEELESALKAFNEANESIQLWEPDYSVAIIVSPPSGRSSHE